MAAVPLGKGPDQRWQIGRRAGRADLRGEEVAAQSVDVFGEPTRCEGLRGPGRDQHDRG